MRLMKSLVAVSMLFAATACGGGDDDVADAPRPPDAPPMADAPPAVDAPPPSDAPWPPTTAELLGTVCMSNMDCGTGGICAILEMSATMGICTLECTGLCPPMTGCEANCGPSNGFPGPGVGYCGLTSSDGTANFCAVGCGVQNGGNTMCPGTATCKDLIQGNPPGGDLCAAP
jgi:hypothetical protein